MATITQTTVLGQSDIDNIEVDKKSRVFHEHTELSLSDSLPTKNPNLKHTPPTCHRLKSKQESTAHGLSPVCTIP